MNSRADQATLGVMFRALHQRMGAFLIPNPWDRGTARLLEHLGFEALATTSMGHAFSMGKPDGGVDRDAVMEHVAEIASATALPVSADLQNGFGDAPEAVAETIGLAAAAGAVGGSIEDATGRPDSPIYDPGLATDRIRAAVDAAHRLPFLFTLTARAENYLHGRPDLKDTIERLQAFQEAGADVLYAPGLAKRADIAEVIRSVDRPVNVVMGLQGEQLSLTELSRLGVRRVSVGSALARAALGAFLRAAEEMRNEGRFDFAKQAVPAPQINSIFSGACGAAGN